MIRLDPKFLKAPIAHRALHDIDNGRPENSRAAIQAAIDAGFGIEIDVQQTFDGQAAVFHDYDLGRLTGLRGPIRQRSMPELATIALTGGHEGVPSLREVLDIVAGQVALLIEIKDQDGNMGPDVGVLEQAVVDGLAGYGGPVALMSFNPHSVAACAKLAPHIARGLVTDNYDVSEWAPLSAARCAQLRRLDGLDEMGASFISHNRADLSNPRVAEIKESGRDILCWTVKSAEEEAEARQIVDNVTFEGYSALIPA